MDYFGDIAKSVLFHFEIAFQNGMVIDEVYLFMILVSRL